MILVVGVDEQVGALGNNLATTAVVVRQVVVVIDVMVRIVS